MDGTYRPEFGLEAVEDHLTGHEGPDVTAHAGDLAHERGGDGADQGEAGRKTVWTSGAMVAFMAAICIS